MRKLVVTCECGQRMQVPRSAVGKTGLCPTCGQSITITNDNATAAPPPSAARGSRPLNNARQSWWQGLESLQQHMPPFAVQVAPNKQNVKRWRGVMGLRPPTLRIYPRWQHLDFVQVDAVLLQQ